MENVYLNRWLAKKPTLNLLEEGIDATTQRRLSHYQSNIYLLNKMALKIQHWFFVRRQLQLGPVSRNNARIGQMSSALSYQAPCAPIKKSQQNTLRHRINSRANQQRRRRGTPTSALEVHRPYGAPSCFSKVITKQEES